MPVASLAGCSCGAPPASPPAHITFGPNRQNSSSSASAGSGGGGDGAAGAAAVLEVVGSGTGSCKQAAPRSGCFSCSVLSARGPAASSSSAPADLFLQTRFCDRICSAVLAAAPARMSGRARAQWGGQPHLQECWIGQIERGRACWGRSSQGALCVAVLVERACIPCWAPGRASQPPAQHAHNGRPHLLSRP